MNASCFCEDEINVDYCWADHLWWQTVVLLRCPLPIVHDAMEEQWAVESEAQHQGVPDSLLPPCSGATAVAPPLLDAAGPPKEVATTGSIIKRGSPL
jgi:hypothetical protein